MSYAVCPTCHTCLADKELVWEDGLLRIVRDPNLSEEDRIKKRKDLMNSLELRRYCCRMRILGTILQIEERIVPRAA